MRRYGTLVQAGQTPRRESRPRAAFRGGLRPPPRGAERRAPAGRLSPAPTVRRQYNKVREGSMPVGGASTGGKPCRFRQRTNVSRETNCAILQYTKAAGTKVPAVGCVFIIELLRREPPALSCRERPARHCPAHRRDCLRLWQDPPHSRAPRRYLQRSSAWGRHTAPL